MKAIYQFFIVALLSSLTACTPVQLNTVASSDEDQDIGMGGTGMLASKHRSTDNGSGGTGIVGMVTGFGSIFVNGIEIEYDDNTPFTVNGKTTNEQNIAIGDIVEILTTDGNKYTTARSINVRHEIIGKVESIDRNTMTYKIQGQTVLYNEKMALPVVGDFVAVSGFRINPQSIQATRVSSANGLQSVVRHERNLPFVNLTSNWLVQTHVEHSQTTFLTKGSKQLIKLGDKNRAPLSGLSKIKILQLKLNDADRIEYIREVDALTMPRGRLIEHQLMQPGLHPAKQHMHKNMGQPVQIPALPQQQMQMQNQPRAQELRRNRQRGNRP